MGLFEWWAGLNTWLKVGVAFLLASTALWRAGTFWPWGWGVGVVLQIFARPSRGAAEGVPRLLTPPSGVTPCDRNPAVG